MKKYIENLISGILSEEIEKKSKSMGQKMEGEWTEIEVKEKLHGNQKKLDVAEPKGKLTAADFKKLSKKKKDVDESETDEGNAFTGALAKAKKEGDKSFKVDGKHYEVKEELGLTLKDIKKESHRNGLKLTEDELIDLIENIVIEQKETKENNISKKEPEGLKKTNKVLDASKKENEDYAKEVVKKMKDYLKDGSKGVYEMNPDHFPKGNGELKKMDKKAYTASGAVEEYIENFARAAGLEELVYDEIEPHEDWVKDNIKGSARTGNNPKWGNAVETELGEKLFKKSQKKPYSTEKRKGSYKRQSQPVDKAGEHDGKKSIDDMFAKLESKENKKEKMISEEMQTMKNLISYNRKTQ